MKGTRNYLNKMVSWTILFGLMFMVGSASGAIFEVTPTGSGVFSNPVYVGYPNTAEYLVTSHASRSVPITLTYSDQQDQFPAGMQIDPTSGCQNGTVLSPPLPSCILKLAFIPTAAEVGQTLEGGPVVSYKNVMWRSQPAKAKDRIHVGVHLPPAQLAFTQTYNWADMIQHGSPETKVYRVENRGGVTATLNNISLHPGDNQTGISGGSCQKGGTLEPNHSCTIEVTATPSTLGTVDQSLEIANTGLSSPLSTKIHFTVNAPGTLEWLNEPTWNDMQHNDSALAQTYAVQNTGGSASQISSIGFVPGGDSRLTLTGGSCDVGTILNPGGECTITVQADPDTVGAVSQQLQVAHDGTGSPLTGTISFMVKPIPGYLGWNTEPSWGDMVRGDPSITQTYELANDGETNVILNNIGFNPNGDARLSIVGGSCSIGTTLTPTQTCTIYVQVNPTSAGILDQSLEIANNGTKDPLTSHIYLTVNEPGKLEWKTPIPTWADMIEGDSQITHTYTLENTGGVNATINSVGFNPNGDNRLDRTGGTCNTGTVLSPLGTCTIAVTADPTSSGGVSQTLQIHHDGELSPLGHSINFMVYAPGNLIWNSEPTWPTMTAGEGVTTEIYAAKNSGGSALTINDINVGSDPRLTVTGGTCSGATLSPGQTCSINVQADPTTSDDFAETLQVTHTGSGSLLTSGINIVVNEPGTLAWSAPLPTWSNMDQRASAVTKSYTVENVGEEPAAINSIELIGGDARLSIDGGTCSAGVTTLAPAGTCTIDVKADPVTPGAVNETLQVEGTGAVSTITTGVQFFVKNVVCWGYDNYGQSTSSSGTFTQISAGDFHTCGIKADGKVVCWGLNNSGQSTPSFGTFSQISAGGTHACGIRTDGSVACWGSDSYGQSTVPSGTFTQISAGWEHTCGIKADGTVDCWGYDFFHQSDPSPGTFTQISAGGIHTCGIRTDGSVACWGSNIYGQSDPPSGTFSQISAGWVHSCGIRLDGTIACWGYNDSGQSTTPSGTFTRIAAGGYHTCGIRTDGTAVCWGSNSHGQSTPLSGTFAQVSTGYYHSCGIR